MGLTYMPGMWNEDDDNGSGISVVVVNSITNTLHNKTNSHDYGM